MIALSSVTHQGNPMSRRITPPALLLLCLCAGAASAQTDQSDQSMTEQQQLSYTFGVQVARTILSQNPDIDSEALIQGIRDALGKQGLKLSNDQMRDVLLQYRQAVAQKQQQVAADNKKKSEAFLADNKMKEGVKVLPSGVQYRVIEQGKGKKPSPDDSITVNYEGKLIDGTVFDSSYQRGQPVTLKLDKVIKGWQIALPQMSVGSKWMLYIPPELAYGNNPPSPVIGPNSALIFKVELLSIN